MGLSDLISIARRAFGLPDVAAAPLPPAAPAIVPPAPAMTDPDSAWLGLCRPLVQFFESCELTSYWDPTGKVWTCGWGATGPDVKQGTVWTQEQADARLDAQLADFADICDRVVTVPLTDAQKAAVVSILYNVGPGRASAGSDPGKDGIVVLASGKPSTLLRMLNAASYAGAADQFLAWNRSGGVVLGGLVRRRSAERSLFLTGQWSK